MLYNRVKSILEYVRAVKAGDVPINHEIMRDCKSLCQRLPVLDSSQFQEDFFDVSSFSRIASLYFHEELSYKSGTAAK